MYIMMRLLAGFISIAVLSGGVLLTLRYFEGNQTLLQNSPDKAFEVASTLLVYLLISAVVAVLFFAILIYVVLTRRVSARKMAYKMSQDALLSQEQFRKLYELSPVPYIIVTQDGTIERPNTASLRFLGFSYEELVGKNIFAFLSTPDHPDKISIYKEQAGRRVPLEKKEVVMSSPNRPPRWALLSVQDLSGSYGAHKGLATLVDIHEQKELDRIKTEFLSLASHQLRAPLANLKWYIDFLLKRRAESLTQEVTGYLAKMYRRNEDMIELVNTLLNLSRIEMGRVKVEREHVDISVLARSVVEELEPAMQEKGLILNADINDRVELETDGKLIRIVLQNLLSNAIRYTPQGGSIAVRLSPEQGGVDIEVQDTGIGIPPEEQGHIFQKLYRAANAREMEANGNGIGLYMCKALLEGMNGSIDFTSISGEGTTFKVHLPA
jgi:PAS domain S-box-containing protein